MPCLCPLYPETILCPSRINSLSPIPLNHFSFPLSFISCLCFFIPCLHYLWHKEIFVLRTCSWGVFCGYHSFRAYSRLSQSLVAGGKQGRLMVKTTDRVSYQCITQYKKLVQKEEEVPLLQIGKKKSCSILQGNLLSKMVSCCFLCGHVFVQLF